MAPTLVPCPSCERHVRAGECACPFCGQRTCVSSAIVPAVIPAAARALLFAAGAAVTAADCQAADIPPYGGPPVFETDAGAPVDARDDDAGDADDAD